VDARDRRRAAADDMAAITHYRILCPTGGCGQRTAGYVYCRACRVAQSELAKQWYRRHRDEVLAAKRQRLGRPRRGLWKDVVHA
jgi:hypothetical protein